MPEGSGSRTDGDVSDDTATDAPAIGAVNPGSATVPALELVPIASGMAAPIALADVGGGALLIADQAGLIWRVAADGDASPEMLLDLRGRMLSPRRSYDERGLLGMALAPAGADPVRVYVYYSAPRSSETPGGWDHESHVSAFTLDAAGAIDPNSEEILARIPQPQSNHNGGQLAFGPDGNLYIGLGDGGGANDIGVGHPDIGNGQARDTLLGSILRITPDGAGYAIPKDNPFAEGEGRGEIWAYGFRNPFRFSFDASTGRLLAGDVGQNRWEEVDLVERGGNYGWPLREGPDCFDADRADSPPPSCPDVGRGGEPLRAPILSHQNSGVGGPGIAVIGGYIYRGEAIPELKGRYVYGDWSAAFNVPSGGVFVAAEGEGEWSSGPLSLAGYPDGRLDRFLLSFGQDLSGEIYLLTSESGGPSGASGAVHRLGPH